MMQCSVRLRFSSSRWWPRSATWACASPPRHRSRSACSRRRFSAVDAAGAGVSLPIGTDDPGIAGLGAAWYFNWHFVPHADVDLPYVPLVCGYPGDGQVSEGHLGEVESTIRANAVDYPDGTLFLIGNEIGYTHQKDGPTAREYPRGLQALLDAPALDQPDTPGIGRPGDGAESRSHLTLIPPIVLCFQGEP